MKKNIITLGGSNSKNSITKTFAEYTGSLLNDVNLITIDLNDYLMPMYSVDEEARQGFPENAKALNEVFDKADGFIICLAEHNGSYSVAFKNVLDWLSRIEHQLWRQKPMLLFTAAPGERGGETLLNIALDRFPYLGANIIGSLAFPLFNDNFKEGDIVNKELKNKVLTKVSAFENAI